jgi:hypothetical protein
MINTFIDAKDLKASPANTWFFNNFTDSGNNTNVTFNTISVTINYADVKDCIGSPLIWYGINSIDSGNNTNWSFSAPKTKKKSGFLMFFN